MINFTDQLRRVFLAKADPDNAQAMVKYMRDQFAFLGIKKPVRVELQKPFFRKDELPDISEIPTVIHTLWEFEEREFQYAAIDLLEKYQKRFSSDFIILFEWMISTKSWWDTVDLIASKFVGTLFFKFPELKEKYIETWFESDHLWLQRTCLLFQLKYKEKTDQELLSRLISHFSDSEEFFLQKAIGWILREYSKQNPRWVETFVNENQLSNLSKREALKWIKKSS